MEKVSNKSWPSTLAPCEKLVALGHEALTDIELLALFLRTCTRRKHVRQFAEELPAQFGSFDKLMTVDHQTLSRYVRSVGLKMYAAACDWHRAQRIFRSHLMRENAMTKPGIGPGVTCSKSWCAGKERCL